MRSKNTLRLMTTMSATAALFIPLLLAVPPASAAPTARVAHSAAAGAASLGVSPGVLKSYAGKQLARDRVRRSRLGKQPVIRQAASTTTVAPAATAALTGTSALVLYDTAGQYGFLGELYGMATANLSGHFGTVKTEPVSAYSAGQMEQYTATLYVGSTYYDGTNDAIPAALYQDAAASSHPLVWTGFNIWNFANSIGIATFESKYGWDPTTSYLAPNGSVGNVSTVVYKGRTLTRKIPAGQDSGIVHPHVLGAPYPPVTTLATAQDGSTSPATAFPWAVRSGNLTYIGEIPFSYVSLTDRIIAFEDLLFDALAPATAARHRALVRLEDISPKSDPTQLMNAAKYLFNNNVPYGFNVIPWYRDPLGHYNNGVAESITLAQAPAVVTALKYMISHGGTIIDEGYTHQYRDIADPYNGVSGDDFEFFRAHIDVNNSVIFDGTVPEDTDAWAQGRITAAIALFRQVGLPAPSLWVTPHYAASDVDYRVFARTFAARYESSLYYPGTVSGGAVDHTRWIGQFFPYVVHDVYGTTVLPENLGDYEPVSLNNNPVRLPADIINAAKLNLAIRDGFASFFYDPSEGTSALKQTVSGIRTAGYTFVSPASVLG